jgi:hypothetical protein
MGTRARDFSRIVTSGAANIAGSNLTIADILPLLTTANVIETANLYFTNARVFANVELASINIFADVDTETNPPNVGYALVWDGNVWAPSEVVSNVDLAGFTTDDLPEGNVNLYFTNARSRAAISPANPTIIYDPNTGLISANLVAVAASANTTDGLPEGFINLYYADSRAHANLKLASIDDLFDVAVPGVTDGKALIYNGNTNQWVAGDRVFSSVISEEANTVLQIGNFTTDNLAEGSNNLYYTNLRVESFLSNISINVFSDVNVSNNLQIGKVLGWTGTTWEPFDLASADLSNVTLSNVTVDFAKRSNVANIALSTEFAERSNVANIALSTDFAERSNVANIALSTDFAERSNVANSAIFAETANTVLFAPSAGAANTVASIDNFTTDDLVEGSNNLYYTDARVYANLELSSINVHYDVNVITPSVGDILRWDGSYWSANSSSGEASSAIFAENANIANVALFAETANVSNAVVSISNFTTDDLPEGANNYYYTNARLEADVQSALIGKDLTLDDLVLEGDLTVRGNTAAFIVANLLSTSKTLVLDYQGVPSTSDGAGIVIDGANASIVYSEATDSLGFNKTLIVDGNILPAIGGTYSIGTFANKWKNIYLGADTIFLGNISLSQNEEGGLEIRTADGDPVDLQLGNVIIDNVTADRLEGNVLTFFSNNEIILQASNVLVNGNTIPEISRDSISVSNTIVSTYSNTSVIASYDSDTGVITINQDGVYESTAILTLTDDWQDTPVKAAFIPTGTYIVQIVANDSAVGGGHTQEYYSGVMSWYSSDTNSGTADEIALHRAGAGPGNGTIFLRIQRTLTANADDMKLQIAGTTTNSGTSSYIFKFRRLL